MKPPTRRKPRHKRAKLDHDKHDYWFPELTMEKGLLPNFAAVAEQDGMKIDQAILFLMRWAVSQGTLCPITEANESLASDLVAVHHRLTAALQRVKIKADPFTEPPDAKDDDSEDDGEKWKGEAA